MKKLWIFGLSGFLLAACSHDGDKLVGQWINDSGQSVITIEKGKLGFNYNIGSNSSASFINEACKDMVIFSNRGFNCYTFPNKTGRLIYQPAIGNESEELVASDIQDNDETYHRLQRKI